MKLTEAFTPHGDFEAYRIPGEALINDSMIRQTIRSTLETLLDSTIRPTSAPPGVPDLPLFTLIALSTTTDIKQSEKLIGTIDREQIQDLAFDIMKDFGFVEKGASIKIEDKTVSPQQPGLMREIRIWPSETHKGLGFMRVTYYFRNVLKEEKIAREEWSVVDLRKEPSAAEAYILQKDLPTPYAYSTENPEDPEPEE